MVFLYQLPKFQNWNGQKIPLNQETSNEIEKKNVTEEEKDMIMIDTRTVIDGIKVILFVNVVCYFRLVSINT